MTLCPLSVWLTLLCYFFEAKQTTHYSAASVLAATGNTYKLVLCFKHFVKEQVPVSEDFNIDSVHMTLFRSNNTEIIAECR